MRWAVLLASKMISYYGTLPTLWLVLALALAHCCCNISTLTSFLATSCTRKRRRDRIQVCACYLCCVALPRFGLVLPWAERWRSNLEAIASKCGWDDDVHFIFRYSIVLNIFLASTKLSLWILHCARAANQRDGAEVERDGDKMSSTQQKITTWQKWNIELHTAKYYNIHVLIRWYHISKRIIWRISTLFLLFILVQLQRSSACVRTR